MTFRYLLHNQILRVFQPLDRSFLESCETYFSEGTRFPREIRADRDGIRFPIQIDDVLIKFEIVAVGRIGFNAPIEPSWSPVGCLDVVDQVMEKLMTNGDRWAAKVSFTVL